MKFVTPLLESESQTLLGQPEFLGAPVLKTAFRKPAGHFPDDAWPLVAGTMWIGLPKPLLRTVLLPLVAGTMWIGLPTPLLGTVLLSRLTQGVVSPPAARRTTREMTGNNMTQRAKATNGQKTNYVCICSGNGSKPHL